MSLGIVACNARTRGNHATFPINLRDISYRIVDVRALLPRAGYSINPSIVVSASAFMIHAESGNKVIGIQQHTIDSSVESVHFYNNVQSSSLPPIHSLRCLFIARGFMVHTERALTIGHPIHLAVPHSAGARSGDNGTTIEFY